jgi:RNA polymerase sigma-70 factor (ECF subfamily)
VDVVRAPAMTPAPFLMNEYAEAYYDRLFRVAFSLCRDRHAAEDLTQETFTASFKSIETFRGESELFTWLVAILRRLWLNRRRDRNRVQEVGEIAAPEEDAERRDAREELERAMERLDDESRLVLTLYHVEDMKYEEIAAALQTPIGTVKSRLHEARRKLRSLIHAV